MSGSGAPVAPPLPARGDAARADGTPRRLLAVSPHLDDAAFSAGGTLAAYADAGWEVTVATCFTGNVARPTGFALACQLDKGLAPEVDYMALRRAEDLDACAALGARAVHLPFLEAPHRGYAAAPALFADRRADDTAVDALAPALAALLAAEDPDLILSPLCLGDHVDHHVVREALARVAGARPCLAWEDWPYADRPAVHTPHPSAPPALAVLLDEGLRARRLAACAAYASQLGFQFGGREALAARVAAIAEERFHNNPARAEPAARRPPTRATAHAAT